MFILSAHRKVANEIVYRCLHDEAFGFVCALFVVTTSSSPRELFSQVSRQVTCSR